MEETTTKSKSAEEDDGQEVLTTIENEGPLRRKSLLANPSSASPKKVYPAGGNLDLSIKSSSLEKKSSKNAKAQTQAKNLPRPPQGVSSIVYSVVICLAVCICLAWTFWLILLNVAPNDTVNRVMDTEAFEYGSFWLMVNPSSTLMGLATLGLSVIEAGHLVVLIKLLLSCRRNSKLAYVVNQSGKKVHFAHRVEMGQDGAAETPAPTKWTTRIMEFIYAVAQEDSEGRKYIKLAMKFGDLALETVLLHQMLESGSPAGLVAVFTVIVACNALSCAVMLFIPFERAPLAEILVDILFDFLVIVGCPMLVVLYCFSAFSFDRAKYAINLEVFPAGWFEQSASVIADPIQTAVIYRSLKSLRIMSALDFFTRMGVNITLCYRLHHIVGLLYDPRNQQSSVYPKRHRLSATVLVIFAGFLVLFVEESMRTSAYACQPHRECAVNARRWIRLESDSLTQCPCLILIDRDIAPRTYAEWENPTNVMEKVAQLATTGDLQTLQLTNRFMADLPGELRRCTNLRHLSLEYTHTQTFPTWISEFTQLEFLHIESKGTSPVVALPDNMFDAMPSLTFIHFAAFMPLTKMPSFWGLTNLKSLTLAVLVLLEELPDFQHLGNLERLVLASMPALNTLPDFTSIPNLKSFAASDRGAWCCNGFLGECDLSDGKCGVHPVWGSPAVSCLSSDGTTKTATAATIAAVEKFSATICGPVLQPGVLEGPPTPELMAPCNGTMYRQCPMSDGSEAMCYNARYMAIACTTNAYPIKMRRRQIAEGVGDPCDPEVEAWLGCK